LNGDKTVTLYTVQIWWREMPDDGDGSSTLVNNVKDYRVALEGNIMRMVKANGDVSFLNLSSTQLVHIMEKKQ